MKTSSKALLTHFSPDMRGEATFYYVIDQVDDIEVLEVRDHPGRRLSGHEQFLVARVRIKPYDHIRWTWFSFLDKECVSTYSPGNLIREAHEVAEVFAGLEKFLLSFQKTDTLHAHAQQTLERFWVVRAELSYGPRKRSLVDRLIESLSLFPAAAGNANAPVENALVLLARIVEKFYEEGL